MKAFRILLLASMAMLTMLFGCDRPARVVPADTSRTSLDWAGVYTGTLPCGDCEGIRTALRLNADRSYVLRTSYIGKSDAVYESRGTFEWNEQGNRITLKDIAADKAPSMYLVGENKLIQLDLEGNRITGDLATRYEMQKADAGIMEKYWKLVALEGNEVVWENGNNREPHIILKGGGRFQGSGGCNLLSGEYELKEGRGIALSAVASTRMACPTMDVEAAFLRALANARSYALQGDTLRLTGQDETPLATFAVVYLR
ncbi:MAG: hypothetical protein H6Q30_2084 [Bacteroidetes bacterium]|nr:hypothetical protein [Bacteroidota bacterium]